MHFTVKYRSYAWNTRPVWNDDFVIVLCRLAALTTEEAFVRRCTVTIRSPRDADGLVAVSC